MSNTVSIQSPFSRRTAVKRGIFFLVCLITGVIVGNWLRSQGQRQELSSTLEKIAEGETEEALLSLDRHLEADPTDWSTRIAVAKVLAQKSPEIAIAKLRVIPRDVPEYVDAARLIVALSLKLGRDYDALLPALELERLRPEEGGVQLVLAEIYFRARDFEQALDHGKRCRDLSPNQPEVLLLIAEALDELKRPEQMIEPLEAALKLNPNLEQAHLNLAYSLQLAGRHDEAREHADWFLSRFSNVAAAHRISAQIERSRGQHEAALAAVRRSLKIQPRNLESGLLEVELLLFLRRFDEGYERSTKLAEQLGDERRLLTVQARAALLAGHKETATRLQDRLSRLTANE